MTGRRLAAVAIAVAALLAPPIAAAAGDATSPGKACSAPAQYLQLRAPLARTATRLARHERLTIVAIGSSSTAGYGASAPTRTYPSRLAAEFARRLPGQEIAILNKGVSGETSVDMLARFDRDVFAAAPDLVIWQVGTNAVLRDMGVEPYGRVVRDGIDRLKSAGIDVVLMDLQYAPKVLGHPLYREMENTLASLGKAEGVAMFRRFALMQHWVAADHLDFSAILTGDGLHLNDASYNCIGRILADAIIETAAPTQLAAHR